MSDTNIVRPWQAGVLKKGLQYMTICKRTGDKGTRCRHKKIIPKLPKHKEPTLSHHIPHTLSIRQYQNPNHLPSTVHTPTPTRMFVCTYMHVHVQHVHTYMYVHTVHGYMYIMYELTEKYEKMTINCCLATTFYPF